MGLGQSGSIERPIFAKSRTILLAGFGGLLLLMAFAGVDAVQVLRHIQSRNDAIQRDFLARNRALNQLRSDVYLSGTYFRDYILEPQAENANTHRDSLSRVHRNIDNALVTYSRLLTPQESGPFAVLRKNLDEYWKLLTPGLAWTPAERRSRGFAFLRDEVMPRRMAMVGIADQIARINEQQLQSANRRISELFYQFRTRLTVTLLATLSLGLLLAVISVRQILQLENSAALRFRDVELARSELKHLSARLVEVQENERKAISRELHDEVGQSLSALSLGLGNLASAIPKDSAAQLQGHVEGLRKLSEGSVGVVRNMALLLRPSMLDDLGLLAALQWQARETSRRSAILVSVAADGIPEDLPDEHRTCIYRVVQEALHNAARHSGSSKVMVTVDQRGASLRLTVQDDGKGFNPERERGLGLVGMAERVTNLGGNFLVESASGTGTLIVATLPLPSGALSS